MVYLSNFEFPDVEKEYDFLLSLKRTCYDSFYPFQTVSKHNLESLTFEPVTILYGGNGSGKTTVLNIIAEKLGLERDALYNRSNFFHDYTRMCDYELEQKFVGKIIAIIHREDDVEEKWVVVPENITFTKDEIMEQVYFQEKYFKSEVRM